MDTLKLKGNGNGRPPNMLPPTRSSRDVKEQMLARHARALDNISECCDRMTFYLKQLKDEATEATNEGGRFQATAHKNIVPLMVTLERTIGAIFEQQNYGVVKRRARPG